MTEQIKKEIQKVSLPSAWTKKMILELDKEKEENVQAEMTFAQNLKSQISEYEKTLDKLLDLQLSDTISTEEYAAKKQKILNRKIEISEKLKAFEQKSHNRFELANQFIKEANQAQNIALQENPEQIRDFLKKIGSNFQISDRTLFFDFKNAWKILTDFNAEVQSAETSKDEKLKFFTLLGR